MLRRVRQAVQMLFWLLFLFLIVRTVWRYTTESALPVDLLLRFDPLVGFGTMLASRTGVAKYVFPSLGVIVLTVLAGRFFCGWICPLGTTLDISRRVFLRRAQVTRPEIAHTLKLRTMKYYILAAFGVSALLGIQLVWVLDPLALVTRSYALSLYAYFNFFSGLPFRTLYQAPGVREVSEPIYAFLQSHVLALNQPIWRMHLPFFLVLVGIVSLEGFHRRFWCRNLCPLGALLGVLARFALLRRVVGEGCTDCGRCFRECRTGTIGKDPRGYLSQECTACMTCREVCPPGAVAFKMALPLGRSVSAPRFDLSRRSFVKATVVGAGAVPLLRLNYGHREVNPRVVRPPGARPEEEFLDKCIRCGECIKVCPTYGLQPTFLEAGLEGIWTPMLVPKVGYCEYVCVACTKVCPTNAIVELTEEVKKNVKIGTADISKSRCIPWSEHENCLVCEEVCPIPTKAIKFNVTEVQMYYGGVKVLKLPIVLKDKCIGCGICENRCPVRPWAAITVTCRGEGRRIHGGLIYAREVGRMERPE